MLQNPTQLIKDDNPIEAKEGIIQEADPLSIDIEDSELARVLEKRITDSKKYFNSVYQLDIRREKNETYLLGRQIGKNEKANKLRGYEARYQDNALYEIEASIKPVALSRMPNLIVTPGNPSPEAKESAKNISLIVDSDIKTRQTRKVLGMGFKHLPIYFTGIIKCIWNPELDDYEFINIHPNNIVVDEQCPINDVDYMSFVAEAVKTTPQQIIMRFPKKETEFIEEMNKQGVKIKQGEDWKLMATSLKYWEVWFTWYKKAEENQYERIEGLLWKYGDIILKKMKNPNYDYEGEKKFFTYDEVTGEKHESKENELAAAAIGPMMGLPTPNIQQETIYRNYFDMPHKPYYFMGYDQLGKIAYDETSRIEQNIYNQENIDTIGKRIIEKLKDRGKHIFSKEAGLTGKDLERMDMNNPDQDILAEGDVNKVHAWMQPPQPSQPEFAEIKMARERMFTLAGATNLSGILQSNVATSNQIAREANFSRIDDITEETINAAAEWMARWTLQMIKLRYSQEKMRKILGSKGTTTFLKIKSDMIDDGMEVHIKASGSDKQKRSNLAIDLAKLKSIDPLSLFEDLDLNDPEGRTEKLLMLSTDPQGYLMKFVMNLTPEEAAAKLNAQPMPGQPAGPEAPRPPFINPPQTNPQQPIPGNTAQAPVAPPTGVAASPQ